MTPIKYSHEAFARHMAENPHDTAAPLVYADWLAENGMPTAEGIVREHSLGGISKPEVFDRPQAGPNLDDPQAETHAVKRPFHNAVTIKIPSGNHVVRFEGLVHHDDLDETMDKLREEGFHVPLYQKPYRPDTEHRDQAWDAHRGWHNPEEPHQMSRDDEGDDPLVAMYARSIRKSEIDNKKIHDQIAGTRLAYHLKQIQGDYADRADPTASRVKELAGLALKGATGGDPYTELGSLLKQDKHKLASAYNWHRVTEGLNVDHAVKSYLDRVTAKERAKGTKGIYQTVSRMMDHHDGTAMGGDQYERFWKGLRKHLADQLGGVVDRRYWTDDRLNKSLLRHSYREQDRADLAGEVPESKPESGPKPTSHSWQKYFGMVPAKTTGVESAERFKREAEYHSGK